MRGVSVVAVEGKSQIPKYWRLFTAFGVPLLVLFDNDDDGVDSKRNEQEKRKSNNTLATCFGIPLERILHQQPWIDIESARLPKTPLVILGKDFEAAVRADLVYNFFDLDYSSLEQEAKTVIKPTSPGQGKGLIARYVARRVIALEPGYCPEFAKRIAILVNHRLGFIAPEDHQADDIPF
jgi:putative ATP-dependent endonuclease of OLD family